MREVTRALFQDHLTLRAMTEVRVETVVDTADVERTRIERGRKRLLATVFGKVTVTRIAYRGTGVADLHVADAVLNLPAGVHSHGLGKLTAIEAEKTGSTSPAPAGGSTVPRPSFKLRALRANGDLDAYWTWHGQQEYARNHQTRYRHQLIPAV